jgi:hypothetical protein
VEIKSKKPRKLSNQQVLIGAFLKDTKTCNWQKEMRMANILIKEYGFDFLLSLKGRAKVISLVWFLGDNGKRFLKEIKNYQSLDFKPEEIKLQDEPVAEKTEVEIKPTSLKDFLNIFNRK